MKPVRIALMGALVVLAAGSARGAQMESDPCGSSLDIFSLSFSFTIHTDLSGTGSSECFRNRSGDPWSNVSLSVPRDSFIPTEIGCLNRVNDFNGGKPLFAECISPAPEGPDPAVWLFFGGGGVSVFDGHLGFGEIALNVRGF